MLMNLNDKVAILIVTHNHADTINDLINSLNYIPYTNIYFCDANSTDGTATILKNSRYKTETIFKKKLEGFAKNNNDLIRHFKIKANYFLLLNPDTYFNTDFLSPLITHMEKNKGVGIAVPKIMYSTGQLQKSWKKFPKPVSVIKKRLGITSIINEKYINSYETEWALGACLLISNSLLKENNTLLDERYRLYCEDIDICLEAWYRSLKVQALDDCVIYHNLQEKSSKKIFSRYNYWNIQSIIKFIVKWKFSYFTIIKSIRYENYNLHIKNKNRIRMNSLVER